MEEYLRDRFPQLTKDQRFLGALLSNTFIRDAKKGEVIIDYGSYVRFVPLVVKGLIKVVREHEDGRELLLYFLTGGDTCAATFSCCMIRKRSEIKAVADQDTRMIAIPLEAADHWMSEFATWRNFIMNMYDERLFAMIDTIDKLAFAKLDEKLWDYLTERQLATGDEVQNVSHQQIADDLNVSREAISRILKKLEHQGRVDISRNRIVILSD